MSWNTIQLKYQLIRISEILLSWARFTKSTHFDLLRNHRADLLVDEWSLPELENLKANFWDIIVQSKDRRLYEDLKQFFVHEEYHTDPTSMTSVS